MASLKNRKPFPVLTDERARETPERVYSIIPKTTALQDGFVNFDYQQLARAVNKMSWWLDQQLGKAIDFETFAYIGLNDHRYTILCLAAMKTRRQILLTLFANSSEAQMNLLKVSNCMTLLASAEMVQHWHALGDEHVGHLKILAVPSFEDLISDTGVEEYPYAKTWDEIKNEHTLILHTSGSTGLPKPVSFTHHMLSIFLTYGDAHQQLRNRKLIIPAPPYSLAGIFLHFILPLDYGLIPIILPVNRPLPMTADYMDRVHRSISDCDGGVYIPSLLKSLSQNPTHLHNMSHMHLIFFGGAPLDTETGTIFSSSTTLIPLMGSTEVGAYGLNTPTDRKNWQWYEFDPASGIKFIQFQDDLYETVFYKHEDAEEARKQMVFYWAEGETVYHTKDLWREHPTREGAWMFAGRTDDFVKLACLTKFNATHIEDEILKDERVKAAIMGGDAKPEPFLLLELVEDVDEVGVLGDLWEVIEGVNSRVSRVIGLNRDMICFTTKEKPMPRVVNKGTVKRRETIELYAEEIEELYRRRSARLDAELPTDTGGIVLNRVSSLTKAF